MDSIDLIVLLSAGICFCFFLVFHVVALRIFKDFPAPPSIVGALLAGLALNVVLTFFYPGELKDSLTILQLLFALFVSETIYFFLVFHYIAFVFGMNEASIRVRLLFEVGSSPVGITGDRILQRYNAKQIFTARLARLISAGHFKFDGSRYEVKSPVLLLQLKLINFFKGLLGIRKEV